MKISVKTQPVLTVSPADDVPKLKCAHREEYKANKEKPMEIGNQSSVGNVQCLDKII